MIETKTHGRNLELWARYGQHALMIMPYADEVIVEARGCWIQDADGKRLLDLASGMFCSLVGHNHPKVMQRVLEQARAVVHTGSVFVSPIVLEAAAKLAGVTPRGLNQAAVFATGTEANEFAMWMARMVTGRSYILGSARGYYGTSVGAKSCSSVFLDNPVMAQGFARIPLPTSCEGCFIDPGSRCAAECLDQALESLAPELDNLAAVIVEPFISAGGMIIPPVSYLRRLKRLCEERGALFIADEAQTGLGRTGAWFGIEHYGFVPDIMTLAKGAGNGFPVSAVVTTDRIAHRLLKRGKSHLSSHQSEPVAAAALAAVIDTVADEGLVDRARERGAYFMDRLTELGRRHPAVRNVRGRGLMIALDLVPPAAERQWSTHDFMLLCRAQGVHVTYSLDLPAHGPSLRFLPPLTIGTDEIDFATSVFDDALRQLEQGVGASRDVWPRNPYSAKAMNRTRLGRVISRLWETSPEHWSGRVRSLMKNPVPRSTGASGWR
jgi:2,2-dialkylglycine decarboxylase (pyruvate)